MSGKKYILKKLDYDTLDIEVVNFLPTRFDGNRMFVLPPSASRHLIRRPNPWMAWINAMTAMSGLKPKPPTLPMT
jgi:hypothetical protein